MGKILKKNLIIDEIQDDETDTPIVDFSYQRRSPVLIDFKLVKPNPAYKLDPVYAQPHSAKNGMILHSRF